MGFIKKQRFNHFFILIYMSYRVNRNEKPDPLNSPSELVKIEF